MSRLFSRHKKLRLNSWETLIFGAPLLLGLAAWIGWRLRPPAAIDSFAAPRSLQALTFAPDGTILLVQTGTPAPVAGGTMVMPLVTAYDSATGKRLWRAPQGTRATVFAPTGHEVLLQDASSLARRDARTGVDRWKVTTSNSFDFRFAADGKYLQAWVEVRDPQTGGQIFSHPTLFANRQIAYPPRPRFTDARHLLFRTFDVSSQSTSTLELHSVDILTSKRDVFRLPFRCNDGDLTRDSRYGAFLALADKPRDNSLQLWDIQKRRRLRQWPAPNCDQLFAWSRAHSKLEFYATNYKTKTETPHVFTDGPNIGSQTLKSWAPNEHEYIPGDDHALVAEDGEIVMRDRHSGQKLRAFPSNVIQAAVSPDKKFFATAERSEENNYSSPIEIRIWAAE